MVQLRELIHAAQLERCGERELPVLSMTMHDGIVLQSARFKKSLASFDQSAYKVVSRNQLVVGFPIDEGVLFIQKAIDVGIMSPAYDVWNVDQSRVDLDYLELCLHSPQAMLFYKNNLRGTTARRRSLPKETFLSFPLRLPDLSTQRKIVNIIIRVKQIIRLLHKKNQYFDNLIKARFVEMFGDLRRNPYGWKLESFANMTELITDGEHATPRRVEKGIYLLSARNILNHSLQLEDVDFIDQEEYDRISKRIVPREGDVLISCSGTIGRCCSVPAGIKFQMVRSAALLRFNTIILPRFAEYMVASDFLQEQINQAKTASSQANLFQGKIAKLTGFVPPMEIQEQFVAFVSLLDKSKVVVQKALDKAQQLFDSLMQEYFG